MITKHKDIEITYDENKNSWIFTLRGRERSATSLANAKKTIDAPPPKEEKPFERFEAWMATGYSNTGTYQRVTVTSVKDEGRGSERYWITFKSGRSIRQTERQLVSGYSLSRCNPENDAIVERIAAKDQEIAKLHAEREGIKKTMKTLDEEE